MNYLRLNIKSLFLLGLSAFLIVSAGHSFAQGNGKNNNIGFVNGSDGVMGHIVTGKRIVYTGQELEISVRFARGVELLRPGMDGEPPLVDAYVVVFSPGPFVTLSKLLINPELIDGTGKQRLIRMEAVDASVDGLPPGQYQLGLVLTHPGLDPLYVESWHRGFLGLLDVVGLTISAEALDMDEDGDGEVDCDADGDGFSDEEEDGTCDEGPSDEEPPADEGDGTSTDPTDPPADS